MKAIFLLAGYATRLYPLTLDRPKALLPVNDRPILDYILEEVNKISAVDEIIAVSNHKFIGSFSDWAKSAATDKKITLLDDGSTAEDDRLGAIGDINFAIERTRIDDELLILCGDNLFTFSLCDYYEFFRETQRDCVCRRIIADQDEIKNYAVAVVDAQGKILDMEEKPSNPKSNIAIFATYFYRRDTVPMFSQYLAEGNKPDAPGYFPQWLCERKGVYAWPMNGECYDVGTRKSYDEVRELWARKAR